LPVARSGGGLQASGFRAFVAVSVNPAAAGVLVAWQRQRRASSGRRVPWSATARGPAKWSGLTSRFTGLPAAAGELYVRPTRCRIPDDCIDSKRYPLFIAREAMRALVYDLTQAQGEST